LSVSPVSAHRPASPATLLALSLRSFGRGSQQVESGTVNNGDFARPKGDQAFVRPICYPAVNINAVRRPEATPGMLGFRAPFPMDDKEFCAVHGSALLSELVVGRNRRVVVADGQ